MQHLSSDQRGNVIPEKRVASRKQVFFKGPLAHPDEIDL